MASQEEKEIGHKIIADLFDLPRRDMGGGLTIVELPYNGWIEAAKRDLIVAAVRNYIE